MTLSSPEHFSLVMESLIPGLHLVIQRGHHSVLIVTTQHSIALFFQYTSKVILLYIALREPVYLISWFSFLNYRLHKVPQWQTGIKHVVYSIPAVFWRRWKLWLGTFQSFQDKEILPDSHCGDSDCTGCSGSLHSTLRLSSQILKHLRAYE